MKRSVRFAPLFLAIWLIAWVVPVLAAPSLTQIQSQVTILEDGRLQVAYRLTFVDDASRSQINTLGPFDRGHTQIEATLQHDGQSSPARLVPLGDDKYRAYSLGMKQRLGIAAGLLGDPELLILDEPANGLDPEGVREMRALLGGMANSGRTVLVSSHDLSELEQICDWLVLIDAGRSLYQGPTADLLADGDAAELIVVPLDPADRSRLSELLAAQGRDVTLAGRGLVVRTGAGPQSAPVRPLDLLAADVNASAFEAGITVVELTPRRTSLEDRFLSMIGASS